MEANSCDIFVNESDLSDFFEKNRYDKRIGKRRFSFGKYGGKNMFHDIQSRSFARRFTKTLVFAFFAFLATIGIVFAEGSSSTDLSPKTPALQQIDTP